MCRNRLWLMLGFVPLVCVFGMGLLPAQSVQLEYSESDARVDVRVGGELFTSYLFGPSRRKPILYPVRSAAGNSVNRHYPVGPTGPDEEEDHVHQESLYLTYGDVNGLDFWSHRDGVRIVHRRIQELRSGSPARLEVVLDWVDGEGKAILQEFRGLTFGAQQDLRWVDFDSRLVPRDRVHFGETKEGMFAIRVDPRFREDRGRAMYLSASGRRGADQVWGTRSPWMALQGNLDNEAVTLAIFDHPDTFNHPSYWHARAYGLFSANPLGRKDFVKGTKPEGVTRLPGQTIQFRYRFLIYSGEIDQTRLDQDYQHYIR